MPFDLSPLSKKPSEKHHQHLDPVLLIIPSSIRIGEVGCNLHAFYIFKQTAAHQRHSGGDREPPSHQPPQISVSVNFSRQIRMIKVQQQNKSAQSCVSHIVSFISGAVRKQQNSQCEHPL